MQLPSFERVPQSPQVDKAGIKVVLGGTSFKAGTPIPMFGTYVADGPFYVKADGEPDDWINVIAIPRDIKGVAVRPAREKPNLAPQRSQPLSLPDPSFIERGFFNLDLREHLRLPSQPSRYWLIVSFGDYITDRIPFEIR